MIQSLDREISPSSSWMLLQLLGYGRVCVWDPVTGSKRVDVSLLSQTPVKPGVYNTIETIERFLQYQSRLEIQEERKLNTPTLHGPVAALIRHLITHG